MFTYFFHCKPGIRYKIHKEKNKLNYNLSLQSIWNVYNHLFIAWRSSCIFSFKDNKRNV